MTKKEKSDQNKKLGAVWMQLQALKNSGRKSIRTGPDWKSIQSKHREVIEQNEDLTQAILLAYPNKLEEIKDLRYTSDIEKTIACLNAITPSDQ